MRIVIETENEGRILLEPEAMQKTGTRQQDTDVTAIDAGPPGEELMNAITGSASSTGGEPLDTEEATGFSGVEDVSSIH